jgi:hypothetical protein
MPDASFRILNKDAEALGVPAARYRVNEIVFVVVTPGRFAYLCWNLANIFDSETPWKG